MAEIIFGKQSIVEEKKHIDRDLVRLQETSGFSKLTSRQQKIIKQSLYVQQREKREEPIFDHLRQEQKYSLSHQNIFNWYCHGTINNLEQERGLDTIPPVLPDDFFKTKFHRLQNQTELIDLLKKQGFPCVVHISLSDKGLNDSSQSHTFLALGPDRSGEIIIWDKQGYNCPYRVITLSELTETEYPCHYKSLYWGIRDLKSKHHSQSR